MPTEPSQKEIDTVVSALRRRQGLLIVVSAPSGTGKTTVCNKLLEQMPEMKRSVSLTTRPPRREEREGEHYYFVSKQRFEQERDRGRLAEWARVHGHLYGTPRDLLEKRIRAGKDTVLVIDVKGARSVRKAFPQAVLVFLLPPSWAELEKRLKSRGSARDDDIAVRLRNALTEFSCFRAYDYLIINDDVTRAAAALSAIIKAERNRTSRLLALL